MLRKMWKFWYLLGFDQAGDRREIAALLSGVGVCVFHRGSKEYSSRKDDSVARRLKEKAKAKEGLDRALRDCDNINVDR